MGRFSQAISEGDGISVIPGLEGDVAELATRAEDAGAEAVVVGVADVVSVRGATNLPVVVRASEVYEEAQLEAACRAGADAIITLYDPQSGEGAAIDDLYALADDLGVDCALEIRDEESLATVLERFDPEIIGISDYRVDPDEDREFEHALDLLPDVPAGKLVFVVCRTAVTREQVLALERAGVDALVVRNLAGAPDFSRAVEELVGGTG